MRESQSARTGHYSAIVTRFPNGSIKDAEITQSKPREVSTVNKDNHLTPDCRLVGVKVMR